MPNCLKNALLLAFQQKVDVPDTTVVYLVLRSRYDSRVGKYVMANWLWTLDTTAIVFLVFEKYRRQCHVSPCH